MFQFGFSAYKSGHKDQAVEAYRYAAENGQIGATWKLARMYAEGDGVARDDYEAFKFFSEIAQQDVEPGSPEESYVSDALVALGGYHEDGHSRQPGRAPNAVAAQEYYMRAAANYRNPNAQFEMGKMFLAGEGGVKASVRQAGRWLQLAAEKGHAGAQATLGNLLFQSGKVVRGLAMMTAALERAAPERPGRGSATCRKRPSRWPPRPTAARRSRWPRTSSRRAMETRRTARRRGPRGLTVAAGRSGRSAPRAGAGRRAAARSNSR